MVAGAENTGAAELPKKGMDEVVGAAEVKENMEPDEAPVDDPNTIGLVLVTPTEEDEDAPKANPGDGDGELNEAPNTGDLFVCQLEPNVLEAAPLAELTELVSTEEVEELLPKPNSLAAGLEELNREALVVKDVVPEAVGPEEPNRELLVVKDGVPEAPNPGEEPDEPNWNGTLCATVATPVPEAATTGGALTRDPLPVPKTEAWD